MPLVQIAWTAAIVQGLVTIEPSLCSRGVFTMWSAIRSKLTEISGYIP